MHTYTHTHTIAHSHNHAQSYENLAPLQRDNILLPYLCRNAAASAKPSHAPVPSEVETVAAVVREPVVLVSPPLTAANPQMHAPTLASVKATTTTSTPALALPALGVSAVPPRAVSPGRQVYSLYTITKKMHMHMHTCTPLCTPLCTSIHAQSQKSRIVSLQLLMF